MNGDSKLLAYRWGTGSRLTEHPIRWADQFRTGSGSDQVDSPNRTRSVLLIDAPKLNRE